MVAENIAAQLEKRGFPFRGDETGDVKSDENGVQRASRPAVSGRLGGLR